MVDISIIVPVYKSEQYLRNCLDSLVNQTKKEIEIIAVDDGSPDNSIDILNEYKAKFPEIFKIVRQENQGLSMARNNGIKQSTGRYIAFVDSDDSVKLNTFEVMYKKASEADYDVVACDVDVVYPDNTVVAKSAVDLQQNNLTLNQKRKLFLNMYPTAWNKIYKRDLFFDNDIWFTPRIWFEDVLFMSMLIPKIKSISYVEENLYEYYQREGSITYTYSEKINDLFFVVNTAVEYYKEKGLYNDYKQELEYMYVRYIYATFIKRLSKAKDKNRFKQGVQKAIFEVNKMFPNYKANKYLNSGGFKNLYLKYFNKYLAKIIYFIEKDKMN